MATETAKEFVAALERPRRLVIMVKAGEPTDAVIQEFAPLLEPGDMIIDGGNAHFADTRRRERELREQGIHFVGTGVSGGEEGALHGPSIMPGGPMESYESLGPMLEKISAKAADGAPVRDARRPRRRRALREDGAQRHRVRRHAADRRGVPAAARRGRATPPRRSPTSSAPGTPGRLDSYLIEITAEVLSHVDAATGKPFVDVVVGPGGAEGHGPLDRADRARPGRSGVGHRRGRLRPLGVGPRGRCARPRAGWRARRPTPLGEAEAAAFADRVEQALYASKIVSYTQGFHEIAAGSDEYDWNIDLGAVSSIWRGGCIIRAAFLDRIRAAYDARRRPAEPAGRRDVRAGDRGGAGRLAGGAGRGDARRACPTPGFAAALAYYDALRAERLPAALTQGQRDFFGAHTYRRTDREGSFHTLWGGDRSEVGRLRFGQAAGRARVRGGRSRPRRRRPHDATAPRP